jgi:type IV pilus assembly protein PilM
VFNAFSVGLDIGTANIKMAAVKKKSNKVELINVGMIPTPADTMEGGIINNPGEIGFRLLDLTKSLNIKRGKLTSAVSGSQVYTRLLKMPEMDMADIKKASYYHSSIFLPIDIEDFTTDVFPVRYFEDDEGLQLEVFFIAARKTQVENLYQACDHTGLVVSSVEIEPIALYRSFQKQIEGEHIVGVVNIGANGSYVAIFVKGILVSLRFIALGSHKLHIGNNMFPEHGIREPFEERENFFSEIAIEIGRALDYFSEQGGKTIDKMIICGGGSRLSGIRNFLTSALDRRVEFGEFNEELVLSKSFTNQNISELCFEYPVAIGLALRGVM